MRITRRRNRRVGDPAGSASPTIRLNRLALGITLAKPLPHSPWEVITIVAGTPIVVQGFETTRYLGEVFDAGTRVSASRWSQMLSTAVYILFVALALPVVHTLNGKYGDNSLISLVSVAAAALVVPLIVAAALSPFSAAVADTLAATGNLEETTHDHLKMRWGCVFVGLGATALVAGALGFIAVFAVPAS